MQDKFSCFQSGRPTFSPTARYRWSQISTVTHESCWRGPGSLRMTQDNRRIWEDTQGWPRVRTRAAESGPVRWTHWSSDLVWERRDEKRVESGERSVWFCSSLGCVCGGGCLTSDPRNATKLDAGSFPVRFWTVQLYSFVESQRYDLRPETGPKEKKTELCWAERNTDKLQDSNTEHRRTKGHKGPFYKRLDLCRDWWKKSEQVQRTPLR